MIRTKVILGLPLTREERAAYLLFIATDAEAISYLKMEETNNGK